MVSAISLWFPLQTPSNITLVVIIFNPYDGLDVGDRGGMGYTAPRNVDFEFHFNLTECCWWAQIRTISSLKMMPPVC